MESGWFYFILLLSFTFLFLFWLILLKYCNNFSYCQSLSFVSWHFLYLSLSYTTEFLFHRFFFTRNYINITIPVIRADSTFLNFNSFSQVFSAVFSATLYYQVYFLIVFSSYFNAVDSKWVRSSNFGAFVFRHLLCFLLLCVYVLCAFLSITQFYSALSLSLYFLALYFRLIRTLTHRTFSPTLSIPFYLYYHKHFSLFAQFNEFASLSISFSLFSVMVTSCFEYLFS